MTEKTPGRPRDAATSQTLKTVTLQLVREKGYGAVSVSAISSAAKVSRQTLYNRWSTKAELVLEALTEDVFLQVGEPVPCPTHRAALVRFLDEIFDHLSRDGDTLRSLIASAQEDAEFRALLRDRFVLPREQIVTDLLIRAQGAGELPRDRDAEMLSIFVHGAFWYRLLNDQVLDATWVRRIVDSVFSDET